MVPSPTIRKEPSKWMEGSNGYAVAFYHVPLCACYSQFFRLSHLLLLSSWLWTSSSRRRRTKRFRTQRSRQRSVCIAHSRQNSLANAANTILDSVGPTTRLSAVLWQARKADYKESAVNAQISLATNCRFINSAKEEVPLEADVQSLVQEGKCLLSLAVTLPV